MDLVNAMIPLEPYEPKDVLPRRDWLTVLDAQRRGETGGGIILPGAETGLEKVTEGTGTIIRFGPSELKVGALGLKPGMRIIYRGYIKHANRIPTRETWPDGSEKHYFLMDIEDIFAEADESVDVGVFSGRPQNRDVKHVKKAEPKKKRSTKKKGRKS